jgi:DNA-binding NarL/FixJ family response regulator
VDGAGRIRVLLTELPSMMRDIMRETLESEADVVVVELGDRDAVLGALATESADVVIAGAVEPEQPALPLKFLTKSPRVKVLMLGTSGRRAALYELRAHRTPLADVSPRRLLDTMRSALARTKITDD